MGLWCCCGKSSKRGRMNKSKEQNKAIDSTNDRPQKATSLASKNSGRNYKWQDIEQAAAIRVQSNFRRYRDVSKLHDQGRTTALMRNRLRSSTIRSKRVVAGEDVPDLFRFCGVGFVFGDATPEYDYSQK